MEPDAPRSWRPLLLLGVIVLAILGFLIAPADWPQGDGSVTVSLDDLDAAAIPVRWGDEAVVAVDRTIGDRGLSIELPDGVPVDAPVTVRVRVTHGGEPVQPRLEDVTVAASLPDGRVELVPITRWGADEQALVGVRRPTSHANVALGLLGMVVALWVTGVIPLFVTSLLVPVVLVLGGAGDASEALAPFFHPIIALFFAGFLMAEAMRRVGLDQRIARTLVARASGGPRALFAMLLATAAFLSMWMSNTAAVALLIPIALAVTGPLASPSYQRATILGIAYAATVGGVGSAIGTPANLLAIELLDTFADRQVTFLGWFAFGLPVLVLLLPLIGLHLWRQMDVQVDPERFRLVRDAALDQVAAAPRIDRGQVEVIGVLVVVAVTWLTAGWHGIDNGIVALAGAVTLALLSRVLPEDLGRISWASLITFGGGLTLGLFLTGTGVADWVATRLGAAQGLADPLAIALVATVALATTTVASNTATAAMLIPLAIPMAAVLGIDPTLLVVVIAIASSVDFALVIGTPPTMLAYSTELFTPIEILRAGFPLDVAGLAVTITAATLLWPMFGLV